MTPRLPYALLGLVVLTLAAPCLGHAQEAVTLRVASWASEKEFELETRILEEFMALHDGVRIEFEAIPAGYADKILTSFAAGTVPNVFLLDSPYIPRFVNRDLLLDLRPAADTLGLDLDAFFPTVRKVFEKDGALYALPKDFTPLVMYYNKRLFDASGVAYPAPDWSWQDYLETAQRLTQDTDGDGSIDQYGTAFINQLYLWVPWVWMNGGDLFNPIGASTLGFFNAPKTEEALQFLIDLRTEHGVAPADVMVGNENRANVQGARGMFYSGRLATMPSGRWALIQMMPYIRSGEIDIGVAPLPTPAGGEHVTVLYAAGWCVPKTTKHRAWAIRLAAYLAGEEAARIRALSPIGVPGLQAVAADQVAADSFGIEAVFVEEAAFGRQSWGVEVETFARVEDLARDAVDEVMIVNIWIGIGFQMVIFLAGLKSIPAAFYESARVDGANAWQRFRYVTLPLLRPTTFFVLVTSVIGSFQVFTLIFVMTQGGPLHSTDVVVFHIYQNAYDYLKMGYASAIAWLLFLVILGITWIQFRFLGKRVSYA